MSNFSSNGISCFDGADITNDASMLEVTGMHEQEVVQRMGIRPPKETVYTQESRQGQLVWRKLSLPIIISFSAENMHALNKNEIESTALKELHAKLVGAQKKDRLDSLLPRGVTLGSLIGSIYIEGTISGAYMDLIGCLTHPTISSELPMPFLSTDGYGSRGNFFVPADKQETPLYRIRKHEGATVSPSFLAQYGSEWSMQRLESVPLDSRQTHFLVPRRSPIVDLIHNFAVRRAREDTQYDPKNPQHVGSQIEVAYQKSLAKHRSSFFGLSENPMQKPNDGDLSIPAKLYSSALSKIRKDDESKLTLGSFLEHARLFLFEAHASDSPFPFQTPELQTLYFKTEERYKRVNVVKLTISMFLGVLEVTK